MVLVYSIWQDNEKLRVTRLQILQSCTEMWMIHVCVLLTMQVRYEFLKRPDPILRRYMQRRRQILFILLHLMLTLLSLHIFLGTVKDPCFIIKLNISISMTIKLCQQEEHLK